MQLKRHALRYVRTDTSDSRGYEYEIAVTLVSAACDRLDSVFVANIMSRSVSLRRYYSGSAIRRSPEMFESKEDSK